MAWEAYTKSSFPEVAEWFEQIYSVNLDDVEFPLESAVEFNYRLYKDSKGVQQAIPGLKLTRNKEYKIECKPTLSMKPGDLIRFYRNDKCVYTIIDIEYIIDSRNEHEYIYTNSSWPGRLEESKIVILTLK